MSGEIGIGVRVYIKWNPRLRDGKRCRTGVVVSGPFDPYAKQHDDFAGKSFRLPKRSWSVRLDGDDYDNSYMEPDIEPIGGNDGDQEQRSRQHIDQKVTT